jgi:hypothetical protein
MKRPVYINTFVHQSEHKRVNKLLVEIIPRLKFKVPSSNLDVVDVSQFLKDNMTDKLIGQHSFLGSAPEHPSTIISEV